MEIEFEPSATGRSLGMEWELQLLDADTYDLVDGIVPLLETLPDHQYIKPEFIQNTVEIVSDPCLDIPALEAQMGGALAKLQKACSEASIRLCGAGTHPFSREMGVLTPLPRYQAMEEGMGLAAHTQITFANHLHIGMNSGEEAIAVNNHLAAYLPILIAVSANSPYWRGHETGYASYRQRILAGARSYGIPPAFEGWAEFRDFYAASLEAGIYEGINDIHWDVRPRPHFGTVEVRITDSQPTLRESIDLAAFIYCLVDFIIEDLAESGGDCLLVAPHPWIQRENTFQAARCGLAAAYVDDRMTSDHPLTEQVSRVFENVADSARKLGLCGHLERLEDRVFKRQLGADRQQEHYRSCGSMREVTQMLAKELEGSNLLKNPANPGNEMSAR